MKIKVKDPHTNEILQLEATPAENDKEQGWSVTLPAGNSIFIVLRRGEWKVRHNETIEQDFVNAIGKAINPSSGKSEQTWEEPKNPEKASDERDLEKLLRQKKEAEIRKNNLTDQGETK